LRPLSTLERPPADLVDVEGRVALRQVSKEGNRHGQREGHAGNDEELEPEALVAGGCRAPLLHLPPGEDPGGGEEAGGEDVADNQTNDGVHGFNPFMNIRGLPQVRMDKAAPLLSP